MGEEPPAGQNEGRDPYEVMARFYDLEYTSQDDIPLFLSLAERTGGPVLELGAGTARVALALARAGHAVMGIERSRAMLEAARRKLRSAAGRRVTLVEGDMRSFETQQRFPLAVIPDNTFAWMLTHADARTTLKRVYRLLEPGGILAIVLQNPYQITLEPASGEVLVVWEGRVPEAEEGVQKFWSGHADMAEQLLDVRVWYDVTGREGGVRRHSAQFVLRWFYRPELELLLETSGFAVENVYGSYELEPYETDSPLLIAVAQRS